jgi:geranylgeranyl diphosphate synthase type II
LEKTFRLQTTDTYRNDFNTFLAKKIGKKKPEQLYEPMTYILGLGGKRLRPVLTLMATDAMGGDYKKALPAALALELFHNFSLVHDDIMDGAPLRRGRLTVHRKWDVNTGILSGDAMLIRSYQLFEDFEPLLFKTLVQLFSKTALEVCEGQQYDVDFENLESVSIEQYLHMIRCKTAVLLGACMKTGGLIAGAAPQVQKSAYDFGCYLGIAFQLQDDYLDAFGDPLTFGKQLGGDIIENKKTFLYLKSLELTDAAGMKELEHLFSVRPQDPGAKIRAVKDIYESSGAKRAIREEIVRYTTLAFGQLKELSLDKEGEAGFRAFGEAFGQRNT